jgi:hypothetical protein
MLLMAALAVIWNLLGQMKRPPTEAALLLDSWMDALTAFGLFAVTAMLISYALEDRSHWFVLAFAGACALGSVYGFLQGAWPFGVVEAIWAFVALRRWIQIKPQPKSN